MTELELTQPRAVKYNPAFLSEADLVGRFVVRQVDLELLVEVVEDNTAAVNQHLIVLGPRGSGKTSLLRRAVVEVQSRADLRERWFPVIFSEESYEVTSAGELWLEALDQLADQAADEGLRRSHAELVRESDDQRLAERALGQLLDFADGRGVRLLLIIENLHMLAAQIGDDDAWRLRHTLQTEARIMVMASASSRFDQIDQASKAFYELFKLHELARLDTRECGVVWQMVTGVEPPGSIRPIQILTGGNLRLLIIISSFAQARSFQSLLVDLMMLVDDHTEYFKSHLDGLAAVERKVYLGLAKIWAPATARQVSELARVDVNTASVLLNRLVKRGAVIVNSTVGRKKFYELSERLYNIYYLMRRGGSPANRVKAAVSFMLAYYGADTKKIVSLAAQIAREACDDGSRLREEHISAYAQLLEHPKLLALREQIIRATPADFFLSEDVPERVRKIVGTINLEQAEYEPDREQWLDILVPAIQKNIELMPDEALAYVILAKLSEQQLHHRQAEVNYRFALEIEPDSAEIWLALAKVLDGQTNGGAEAVEAYQEALRLGLEQPQKYADFLHPCEPRCPELGAGARKSRAVPQ